MIEPMHEHRWQRFLFAYFYLEIAWARLFLRTPLFGVMIVYRGKDWYRDAYWSGIELNVWPNLPMKEGQTVYRWGRRWQFESIGGMEWTRNRRELL